MEEIGEGLFWLPSNTSNISSASVENCKLALKNNTIWLPLPDKYGNIPQNLLLNLCGFAILLFIFIIMRLCEWRNDCEGGSRWSISYIFSFTPGGPNSNVQNRKRSFDIESRGESNEDCTEANTFYKWLKSIYSLEDKKISTSSGKDTLNYLKFQRHLIGLNILIVFLSICIILPLNLQGNLQGTHGYFEVTTLGNLSPESRLIWTHLVTAVAYFICAIAAMKHFSISINLLVDDGVEICSTLLIDGIPEHCRQKNRIKKHFENAFDGVEVARVNLTYDITDLNQLKRSADMCDKSLGIITQKNLKLKVYPQLGPRYISWICRPCARGMEGSNYYRTQSRHYRRLVRRKGKRVLKNPLPIAFVTFKDVAYAMNVFNAYRRNIFGRLQGGKEAVTSDDEEMMSELWKVEYAPEPSDIKWENLSNSKQHLFLKVVFANIAVFLIAFFLSTPEMLVSQTSWLVLLVGESLRLSPTIQTTFVPTLLIWIFTGILPFIVSYSSRLLGYWSRSRENHAVMRKSYAFLLFMVVILPSFGFTTLKNSLEFIIAEHDFDSYRWECIFIPDSGAFFINYVITAAFIGNGMELLRLPTLLFFGANSFMAKSLAETRVIKEYSKIEFRFGEQYAQVMLMFNITIIFSISCPLITPFGLIYLMLKHLVDRHNLIYSFYPSKINKQVHLTAVGQVLGAPMLMLFFLTSFDIARNGQNIWSIKYRPAISVFILCLEMILLYPTIFWNSVKKCSPYAFHDNSHVRKDDKTPYVAPIFLE